MSSPCSPVAASSSWSAEALRCWSPDAATTCIPREAAFSTSISGRHSTPSPSSCCPAREPRALRYIDQLLSAFDRSPPSVYAGGPFSGRRGYPDTSGRETLFFPPDSFANFLALARVDELAWRARIDGWRALYPQLVGDLDRAAAAIDANRPELVLLRPAEQTRALAAYALAAPNEWQILVEHVLEGTLSAPEYGGNADLAGWQLARYEGDSAPLGYSFFDVAAGLARERPDEPTSGPSPGVGDEDLDPDLLELLARAAIASGGKRFA
jgi:hypothetical protein